MPDEHVKKYFFRPVILAVAFVWFAINYQFLYQNTAGVVAAPTAAWKHFAPQFDTLQLPQILSDDDIRRYKSIFSLQETENWKSADRYIAELQQPLLLGHVLSQRYSHAYYKPNEVDLKTWVAEYSDHPQSYEIYRMAAAIDPTFKQTGNAMSWDYLHGYGDGSGLTRSIEFELDKKYWGERTPAYKYWKSIHAYIKRGKIREALNTLEKDVHPQILSAAEISLAKHAIARGFYAYNQNAEALRIAEESLIDSMPSSQSAHWTAGMAAWRLHRWEKAAEHFTALVQLRLSQWHVASGAFWAAKAYKKLGRAEEAQAMIAFAAGFPRTFYGVLANVELGQALPLQWTSDNLSQNDLIALMQIPNIKRAMALVELGQRKMAERELRRVYPRSTLPQKQKLLLLARALGIPSLEIRMASMIRGSKFGSFDHALYPVPPWAPEDGFTINPALMYALIRHESGFNTYAKSHVGAKGLMQLMPQTASYIAQKNRYSINSSSLYIPEKNITIGQDYVEYLLKQPEVRGNLVFLASAYNAGPNTLKRWLKNIEYQDDPLLFIESIPSKETRNFVQRILTNYWIYRVRLGYGSPSAMAMLEGNWPMYEEYQGQPPNAPKMKTKTAMLW